MRHLILLHPSREPVVSAASHLSADDVAAFVDRTMPDDERGEAERHLADCDSCREEVASVARLVATAPKSSTRRAPWRALLPIAAALLVAVMLHVRLAPSVVDPTAERGAPTSGSRIVVVAPTLEAPFTDVTRTFMWHAIDGSVGYHVVVKDMSGGIVWITDVADTAVRIPESRLLRTGETYVWRVDGQRADGTSAASAETSFRVSP